MAPLQPEFINGAICSTGCRAAVISSFLFGITALADFTCFGSSSFSDFGLLFHAAAMLSQLK